MGAELIKIIFSLIGIAAFPALLLIFSAIFTFMSFTGRISKDETIMPSKLRLPAFFFGLILLGGAFGTFFFALNGLFLTMKTPISPLVTSPTGTAQTESTQVPSVTSTIVSVMTQTISYEPIVTSTFQPTTTAVIAHDIQQSVVSTPQPQQQIVVIQPQPQPQPTQAPPQPTQAPLPTATAQRFNEALFYKR